YLTVTGVQTCALPISRPRAPRGGARMNPAELVAFVRGLAERPESWAHLVEHDREARTYSELVRTDDVAAWLICWMDDHDTGFHEIGRASCRTRGWRWV